MRAVNGQSELPTPRGVHLKLATIRQRHMDSRYGDSIGNRMSGKDEAGLNGDFKFGTQGVISD